MGPEWALQPPFIAEPFIANDGDWRPDERPGQREFRNAVASCALLGGIKE